MLSISRVEPTRAAALAVLLFSLAGVPPLVGFFGKFYVLMAAVQAGLVWLAVAGVVASVIGAFYYLRIVYLMYFGEASEPTQSPISIGQSPSCRRPFSSTFLGSVRISSSAHTTPAARAN